MPGRPWHFLPVILALVSLHQAVVLATPQEAAVLAQLKAVWGVANNKVSRWNDTVDACTGPWLGITCAPKDDLRASTNCSISNTTCKVTRLDLSNSSLTGEIPFILGGLSSLLVLDLHGNQLVGEVATQLFAGFPNLTYLDFSSNYFNNTIPKIDSSAIQSAYWENNCFSEYGGCRLLPSMRPLDECQNVTALMLPVCPSWARQHPIALYILVGVCPFSVILFTFLILMFCCWRRHPKNQINRSRTCSSKIQSVECRLFTYQELEEATNKFHDNRLLGCGRSGSVYQGRLPNGSYVAVKQLDKAPDHQDSDFWKEVLTIGCMQHPNVVPLRGYCKESRGSERLLVYEYVPNGSVLDALLSSDDHLLPWSRRYSIALGTACGLEFLHEHCSPRIIHKDIKPSNILLGRNFTARVGDFGLAKIGLSQTFVGSQVFVDPEYTLTGKLTDKSDVFSFGMLLLVLIKGRQVLETQGSLHAPGKAQLFSWMQELAKTDDLSELVDPQLRGVYNKRQVSLCARLALLCTRILPELRPSMGEIRRILDGSAELPLNTSLNTSMINSPTSSSRGSFVSEGPTASIGSCCYGYRAGNFISDCYTMSTSSCHSGADSV